jgi:hypothetical protein
MTTQATKEGSMDDDMKDLTRYLEEIQSKLAGVMMPFALATDIFETLEAAGGIVFHRLRMEETLAEQKKTPAQGRG